MKTMLEGVLLVALSGLVLTFVGCGGGDDDTAQEQPFPTTVVSALALPGPYPVACSNIAQNFGVLSGAEAETYWEGTPAPDTIPRYVTDLLADPLNTPSVIITAGDDTDLYGSFAGQDFEFVLFVCYPTGADNPDADYPLPTGDVVPHMQVGAELPLFANAPTTGFPMIAFAHGYRGSPLGDDYLASMSVFASYGYIVAAPFYGDSRFCDLTVDSLSDTVKLLENLSDFTALQALRAISTKAAIDHMLTDPQWSDHIDATQIGGFGASMGGETLLLLGGAGLTTSTDFSKTQVTVDPRLKAAVGYVPFFGVSFLLEDISLPAFGEDQSGLDGVTLPYLAISGTADTLAPIIMVQQGINRLAGTRELVSLEGVTHGFDDASANDIYTWALTFLDAEVRDNPAARLKLSTMASVEGGGVDRVVIPYNGAVVQ